MSSGVPLRREDRWVTERSGSLAAIAPPGHPRRSTLQPRRADLHHGYELVRARGGYITERGRGQQDGKRGTEERAGPSRLPRSTPKAARWRQLGHS